MKISCLGHAAFFLETEQGSTLLTDPYQSGAYSGAVKYKPIELQPDLVCVSHSHADHAYTDPFTQAKIIDSTGKFEYKDLIIKGLPSFHDQNQGRDRGPNIIFKIKADGITLVHFGDLGTLDIDYESIGRPDIALVPVGGTFTLNAAEATELIDKIKPLITIPMHYKTDKLDFDIDRVTSFLAKKEAVMKNRKCVGVTKNTLPRDPMIIVLDPLY